MDLSGRLSAVAVTRVSALVVEVPGWASTRWAVERDLRRRGWRIASSPADADILVICGAPGPRLTAALDLIWDQLPGPRSRITPTVPSQVPGLLDRVVAELLDAARQRGDAVSRPADPVRGTLAGGADNSQDNSSANMDDAHMDHTGMDMDMGDMDMGDMDMEPGGIPLASGGGTDRDGLDLDVLHVPLGPVLPCWPAGLLLHCTLHGDIVAEARPELVDPFSETAPATSPEATSPERLDRVAQLLLLSGWSDAASAAVRLRDALLDSVDPISLAPALDRLTRRITRSRALRWSLRGLGRIDADLRRAHGLENGMASDVYDRLLAFLAAARASLDGRQQPTTVPVELLPELVTGLELFAARLVVASLDVRTAAVRPAGMAAS